MGTSLLTALVILYVGVCHEFSPWLVTGLALCVYFFEWFHIKREKLKRVYRRSPEKFTDNTVIFTNDWISCGSEFYEIRLHWSNLHCLAESPKGLLFLLSEKLDWFWLPQRIFEDNSNREKIIALAKEHSGSSLRGCLKNLFNHR
ncbi:MAG: hypothetical protein QM680_03945 [Luteolibacter sp.]